MMEKTAIKNFAISARKKLIKAVSQKAFDIGIMEDEALPVQDVLGGFIYNEKSYTKAEHAGRKKLVDMIHNRADGKEYNYGYTQAMEEVAYTWFNRLIALRFMEVNGYLTSNIRVLSSEVAGKNEPDVIREVESLSYVDMGKVSVLLKSDDHDKTEQLYKYILIAQCNELSKIMPKMFESIADYTELLLPDHLYTKDGIVFDLVNGINESNFYTEIDGVNKPDVEIIGWLYQYYISEKKDDVFAALKKNVKITKENIPAATQLFTPDWIVKYMVENSLGRLAVEKLNLNPTDLGWRYYLSEAEQTEEVKQQLEIINASEKDFDIKNVKIIDPCMGSGHILVYAFDVLYQIYESLGYSTKDIPSLILTYNIYGLDIDDRAGQLAYFALMMKGRSYSRRFFRDETAVQTNTYSMIESDFITTEHVKLFDNDDITYLHMLFADSKEYGSILKIERDIDYDSLIDFINNFKIEGQLSFDTQGFEDSKVILKEIIEIAKLLTQKYDAVITNPPYMGGSGMSGKLSTYVKKNFADSKSDLFAVFIEKCGDMLKPNSFQAMITQHAFMFLSSYEKLRAKLLHKDIVNMAHLGARAFEEIGGEVVQTTTFVLRSNNVENYKSTFVRLVDFKSQQAKEEVFLTGENRHIAQKENFAKIPGMPVAYWVSDRFNAMFENKLFYDFSISDGQNVTSDNNKFVRNFWEVNSNHISKNNKWRLYAKGGSFRKWYGNLVDIVDWSENAIKFYHKNSSSRVIPEYLWYKQGITWGLITSNIPSFRLLPLEATFDKGGSSVFLKDYENYNYFLGLLNSKIFLIVVQVLNSTLNFQVKDIRTMPIIFKETKQVNLIVEQNISISKTDWDSFETSWDFTTHPLIKQKRFMEQNHADKDKRKISENYYSWAFKTAYQFDTLKKNEEELNRIFIEIYGLQDELTPEVADKNVTICKADLVRDVKSFISYAVGCMFGRYSLDVDGLVLAGQPYETKFKHYPTVRDPEIGEGATATLAGIYVVDSNEQYKICSYIPEEDNIIPITDNDYFDNDIVVRFVDFVRKVYGNETVDENLDFIANALYPNANITTAEKIRKYFLNDFYKDHVKMYQKKPIYWQFESGKIGGFKALVYLHRYDKYTVARVRTDYLHPLQRKYEASIKNLEMLSDMTDNVSEKAMNKKTIDGLYKKISECRGYDQVVAHIAHQSIELDLDDGVTVNYAKFQGVEVPQGDGKADVKMDLFSKI